MVGLSLSYWTEVTSSAGWDARAYHTSVVYNGYIYIMGGWSGTSNLNDVWRSGDGGINWIQITSSAGWNARHGHSSVLYNGAIYVMGGYKGFCLNDVWSSSDGGFTWALVALSAGWDARAYHTSVVYNGYIYIMGGWSGTSNLNDVWRSGDGGINWIQITSSAGWNARRGHSSVLYNGAIYVIGGHLGSDNYLNDVWSSSDGGSAWVSSSASWSNRAGHTSVVFNDIMYIMGGSDSYSFSNDVWSFSDNGIIWVEDTLSAGWSGRYWHTSVVYNDAMYVMGGWNGNSDLNNVWSTMSAPSSQPSGQPSSHPSSQPSSHPSSQPTAQPSSEPSSYPSQPSSHPSRQPSSHPSSQPTAQPSSDPSSEPSSQPSCSLGNGSVDDAGPECHPCPSGQYRGNHDMSPRPYECVNCPKGYFSDVAGSKDCQICDGYPFSSPIEGETSCQGVFLNMSGFSLQIFNAILIFLYIVAILCVKEKRMNIVVISLFPTVDIVSDINYVVTTRYYNVTLFVLSAISILLAIFFFFRKLVNKGAYPSMVFNSFPGYIDNRLFWLEVETDGKPSPSLKGEPGGAHPGYPKGSDMFLRGMDTSHHDSILKVFLFLLCWVLIILLQILSLVSFLLWILMAPFFCCVWFILGVWVYQNKTLATKYVWNSWFQVWTGTNVFDTEVDIDVGTLNESIMLESAIESLPQICLQFANNILIHDWTPIGIFSMIFSGFMAIDGCYRYFYWFVYLGTPLDQVPVEVSLLGLFAIKIEPLQEAVKSGDVDIELSERGAIDGGYAAVATAAVEVVL